MGKTNSNNTGINNQNNGNINPDIAKKFKMLLKIMSWVVGICFGLIILLPLIESHFIDVLVKILFFIGLINLLLFAVLEFFGDNIKLFFSKKKV